MSVNKRNKASNSQNDNVADVFKDIKNIKESAENENTSGISIIGTSNPIEEIPQNIVVEDKKSLGIESTAKKRDNPTQEEVNEIVQPDIEEFSLKRSYALRPSTYLKLQELKVFELPKIKLEYSALNYNDIVDMAICKFYSNIKTEIAKNK